MARKKKTTMNINRTVPFSLLLEAMESAGGEWKQYLDAVETRIVMVPEDPYLSDDPEGVKQLAEEIEEGFKERYWPLPDGRTIREFDAMQSFASGIKDLKARDGLERALLGKGAYRRFKDELYKRGLDAKWYAYRERHLHHVAENWCEDHGFTLKDDLTMSCKKVSVKASDGCRAESVPSDGGMLRRLVIRRNFMPMRAREKSWESLSLTASEISFETVRGNDAGNGWKYETDSRAFAMQFARAGEAFAEILNTDDQECCGDMEFWAEYEDGSKYHGFLLSEEPGYAVFCKAARSMIPPCEEMPRLLSELWKE